MLHPDAEYRIQRQRQDELERDAALIAAARRQDREEPRALLTRLVARFQPGA